jgi:hypothetical protein
VRFRIAGCSITARDPLVRDYKDIELPYGTKAVTAYPQTDTGAFYTYDPAVTLDFAGGQRTLKISVSMPDYSIGVYTLQFKEKPALESVLAGLTVSSGALTDDAGALPASFDPAAGAATVQYITVTAGTGQVIVNALKQTPADKVVFSDGTLQTEGITCVFSPPYPKTFTVTVNGGEGYSNRAYQFKIQEKTPQSAALANMTFAGIPVYQRAQNGANGASGFAPSYTLYNLNFTNESSVIITAVTPAASGTASYTVEMNGVPQSPARPNEYDITLNSLKASNPPVQITLSGWDATGTALLPTTYSVYLVRSNPPAARLAAGGLAVTGGSVQGQFDPNSGGPYRVNVFAGTQVVLVAATPEKPEFAITYIPEMLLPSR